MATAAEWATGYARQARADFDTFNALQPQGAIPDCHKLLFLQMTSEKLAKAHLCSGGHDPAPLQTSHAFVAAILPRVLRQELAILNPDRKHARDILKKAKQLAQEIELPAPAVTDEGRRPENCEYPWVDARGKLHVPLDWSFSPSQLLLLPAGRTFLRLVQLAINRLLKWHG